MQPCNLRLCNFFGEEGKKSIINHLERTWRIFVALALYWCLHMIMQHVFDMQALALNRGWGNALIWSRNFEDMEMSDCNVLAFERNVGFTSRLLLESYMEKMLKQRTRVHHNICKFLCERLGPYLQRKSTHMT